jgi:hypothetical protein
MANDDKQYPKNRTFGMQHIKFSGSIRNILQKVKIKCIKKTTIFAQKRIFQG